jgi:penicillin-binding protein 1A
MSVLNLFKVLLAGATAALIVGTGTVAGLFWHFSHGLPDHKTLADYQPATVSRLYAADGRLLAEYAHEKRVFVPVAAMPKRVLEAFVAAEDQRFFTHPGIDFIGVVRAVIANVANPGKRPEGASGITQQVAKNFLLTNQATLARKIREAILAFRIEDTYSKERILELYLNEIYLGSGNYGVAQAAINYFDRSLGELTLSETAYLAALPKAPNRYSIVRNEKEAYARRDYVLGRMLEDGYITSAEMQQAKAEKLQLRRRGNTEVVTADFFAEEVRRNLLAAYGEKGLYEGGLTVSTTLDPAIQAVADRSLREGLIAYDRRHGWRGPYAKIADMAVWEEEFARIAQRRPLFGPPGWQLAVVAKVEAQSVSIVGLPDEGTGTVPFAEMTWARPTLANQTVGGGPGRPANVVSVGDVIVVEKVDKPDGANAKPYPPKTYALRQVPNVEGGVVVMDTQTGRVLAMSGGWSYGRSQFNRAVQAARQPGSAFKPFVYLAAMDSGLTPASVGLDEPFSYDPGGGQPVWSPKNYGGDYMGAMSLQRALELSRNLVTVRVAQQIGMKKVVEVAKEFGVTDNMHSYLPMALGAGETTLLRMTMAYAMLANGALEITPSLVDRVQDRNGKTVYRHEPRACPGCGEQAAKSPAPPEIVDPRKPFHDPASVGQIVHMLQGVTTRGTAAQLAVLGRPIMGKTGTTNDARDNWFMGSTPDITIGIFVGFDEPRTLGPGNMETGSGNAAPIYERIAREVFKGKAPTPFRIPPGLRLVKWSYEGGTIDEVFKPGTEPGSGYSGPMVDGSSGAVSGGDPSGGGPQQAGSAKRPGLSGTGETY